MSGLYLIAHIAGTEIIISTEEIEAVVRLDEVTPVPCAPPHIAGLSALRSRVLTVIDVGALVTGHAMQHAGDADDMECDNMMVTERHAIVVEEAGHSYALLVDDIDDIVPVDAPCQPLDNSANGMWHPYAHGVMEDAGKVRFLLSVGKILAKSNISASV